MKRVVIVGGGVMGSAAAWRLALRGVSVTLLEQFEPGHDRGSSHGSSRIFRLAYTEPFYVALATAALPLWRTLETEAEQAVLSLTGAVDHGPVQVIEQLHAALRGGRHAAQLLTPEAARERFAGMRFDTSVVFHPDAGRIHADAAVAAFQRAAAAAGAEIRHGVRVTAVRRGRRGVEVVTDDATIVADNVVVAAGGWAPRFLDGLVPGLPPMRVTQEQPLHFAVPDALSWPSFIHHSGKGIDTDGGVYGLGSIDGVKVGFHGVGPVVDPDRKDRSIDEQAEAAVAEYATIWLPGVDPSRYTATTCLYTITPDHDFVVDRYGPVVVLAGFSGHGFKFAPIIGQMAADLVDEVGAPPRFELGRRTGTAQHQL